MKTLKSAFSTKTGLAGLGLILTSVGGWLTGSADPMTAIQGAIAGGAIIFGREAISKRGQGE